MDLASMGRRWQSLSDRLAARDRLEAAAAAARRAVRLFERRGPADAHLASALNTMSVRLNALGLSEPARDTALRALQIYVNLAEQQQAVLPAMAEVLDNLAEVLADLECHDDAARSVGRAAQIRTALYQRDPAGNVHDLAASLQSMSRHLSAAGLVDEATQVATRHVAIVESQEGDSLELAVAYSTLGTCLIKSGRPDDAYDALVRADTLWAALDSHPEEHAMTLGRLAWACCLLKRSKEAATRLRHGVRLIEGLDDAEELLGTLLDELALILNSDGRHIEALDAAGQALAISERLFAEDPELYLTMIAETLGLMGDALTALGRVDAAARVRQRVDDLLA